MEKIIFFGLVIPILGFVLYLGATAIMNGFSAKRSKKEVQNIENERPEEFFRDENNLSNEIKNQVKNDYGKIIMIKRINKFLCKSYKVIRKNDEFTSEYLFDVFSDYDLYRDEKDFIF